MQDEWRTSCREYSKQFKLYYDEMKKDGYIFLNEKLSRKIAKNSEPGSLHPYRAAHLLASAENTVNKFLQNKDDSCLLDVGEAFNDMGSVIEHLPSYLKEWVEKIRKDFLPLIDKNLESRRTISEEGVRRIARFHQIHVLYSDE